MVKKDYTAFTVKLTAFKVNNYAFYFFIKGKVHPKIRILSLITHPHIAPNT